MPASDIRIVKGSSHITTHWPRSWKSYLISENKKCTFSNHALIVIKQLPNNHFHISNVAYPIHLRNCHYIHSSPKVMAVFLFLIFENFLIGGMFSILETIQTDRSTLILQNKNWCQIINPMCTTFQMWQNCILQNQVCFERLINLSKTPYIFVKISKPRNWDTYSIPTMSHGNRTSSYETVAHKLRPLRLLRLTGSTLLAKSYGRLIKHKNEHAEFTQFLWYLASASTTCLFRCCENVI